MSKLNSINIQFGANDKMEVKVRFTNVDVELRDQGFMFQKNQLIDLLYPTANMTFKVIKKDDHILLQSNKNDLSLKGCKKITSTRASGYTYYYPYNTQATKQPTLDKYGSNFRVEMDDNNIKLYPILIEETKLLKNEILITIMRYDTKNNLNK